MAEVIGAVSCYTACQPVAYHTPHEQPNFTALPAFPNALDPLQLTRAEMADYAVKAREMGINYIGSCCGSVAEHVRAMARALGKLPEDNRPWSVDYGKPMSAFEIHKHGIERAGMSTTYQEYEYIVIGLGGLGSGALYWLAKRAGASVLGLEQYELGHERGASEDHSRIIRLSYDQQVYADLARHSYAAWREVERGGQRAVAGDHRRPGPVPRRRLGLACRAHRRPDQPGHPIRAARRRRGDAPLPAVPPGRGHRRHLPGAGRHRAGRQSA